MRILIDMNLSPVWEQFFEDHNIESKHWSHVGKATDTDLIIFEYARQNGYVVFTNDLDFGSILAATNAKAPSVFQIRSQNLMPDAVGSMVISCLVTYSTFLENGSLVTFLDQKSKVRILPLRS